MQSETGIYVRVKSDEGKFVSKMIEELSDTELDNYVQSRQQNGADDGWAFVITLVRFIRDRLNYEV